jgi:hypothetical protein
MSFHLAWQGNPWYLIGSIYFIAAWAALYYWNPHSRRLMLSASLIMLPIGFLLESLYIVDYWRPAHLMVARLEWKNRSDSMSALQFSLEDVIFTFTVAGICAGFFDAVLRRQGFGAKKSGELKWDICRLLMGAGLIIGPIGWLTLCGMNSVWAHLVVCVAATVAIVLYRRDWTVPSLLCLPFGALLMAAFYVPIYQPLRPSIIQEWWLLDNLWGPKLPNFHHAYPGAPIEEVLWGAVTVMCVGVLARFCTDTGPDGDWPRPKTSKERRLHHKHRREIAKKHDRQLAPAQKKARRVVRQAARRRKPEIPIARQTPREPPANPPVS